MSTTTAPASEAHPAEEEHAHDHPSDLKYVKIAAFLAFVTALEVATYFFDLSTLQLVAILFPMMVIKFGTVTAYFMHLKYDNHLFRRVFFFGLILAVVVFMIALFALEFWSDDYLKYLR